MVQVMNIDILYKICLSYIIYKKFLDQERKYEFRINSYFLGLMRREK